MSACRFGSIVLETQSLSLTPSYLHVCQFFGVLSLELLLLGLPGRLLTGQLLLRLCDTLCNTKETLTLESQLQGLIAGPAL